MVGKTGKVYMNTTNPDVSSVTGRRDGFLRAMKEYPNIKVVGIDYNLDVQEKAQAQTAAVLQANPDLKGIFGTNLFSAQGAYQAVANAGLSGVVKIASWDATVDLIKALKDKKVDLVLAQKPYEIGYLAVEWGYKYLTQKATVPKVIRPGSSSSPGRTWTRPKPSRTSTSRSTTSAHGGMRASRLHAPYCRHGGRHSWAGGARRRHSSPI